MSVANITSDWVDGNLVFYDKAKNIIVTWDGTNRKIVIPSGGEIEIQSGGTMNLESLTNGAPGAGISGGTGTVFKSSVVRIGDIIRTSILIDLTGLASSTTDLDIIGQGASAAYLGRITAAKNGTILSGRMTCLEVPTGGADDIDLYSATEATGVFDGGIAALAETALVTSGGAWTLGGTKALSAVPAANEYLYLTGGEAGTAATYTAGKFLIELDGYEA
ncbi:MAG: hypothetical protein ABFD75_12255 [Smithella sp.]